MSASCCGPKTRPVDPVFRRALWIALVANAVMFFAEIAASFASGSVSLLADAIDFFGDAANYALSLAVLAMAMQVRSRAAMFKAACMAAFGVAVLGRTVWAFWTGTQPEPSVMGAVAIVALLVNASVAVLLFRFRRGDSNMRSVWICSRNDAIGNVAVGLAALGVIGAGSSWPDLLVATCMGILAITGAASVFRHARSELRTALPTVEG
jgi:Co/Zn/Cd efflux system component